MRTYSLVLKTTENGKPVVIVIEPGLGCIAAEKLLMEAEKDTAIIDGVYDIVAD